MSTKLLFFMAEKHWQGAGMKHLYSEKKRYTWDLFNYVDRRLSTKLTVGLKHVG